MARVFPKRRRYKGDKKTVSLRLPEDLYGFLNDEAVSRGLPVSDFIAGILDEAAVEIEDADEKAKKPKR